MQICSYSAGVDSVAVSHYMMKYYGVKCIYHYNHNYQPVNSLMEESARRFASDFGIQLIFGKCQEKLKSESEYRKARLNFLIQTIKEFTLITGHHLNDATESYILNCIRGQANYLPIPVETSFNLEQRKIHPFLLIKKDELKKYISRFNLNKYVVEDPTNSITKGSRRNMIRNEIIPILEKEQVGMNKIVRKIYLKYFETNNKPNFLVERLK